MRIFALKKIKELDAGRVGKYTTEKSSAMKDQYGDNVIRISNSEWPSFDKKKALLEFKERKKKTQETEAKTQETEAK